MSIRKMQLQIEGMHCQGCEQTIEEGILELPGVIKAEASYGRRQGKIEFDDSLVSESTIRERIEYKGYETGLNTVKPTWHPIIKGLFFIVLLLLVGGIALWGKSLMPVLIPQLNADISKVMLLGIGVLTGFHCIGMCGSFVVGYSGHQDTPGKVVLAHFAYGLGKTASYSAIGAGFGLLGAAITITPYMRGIAAIVASGFLLIYGLKMLNFFPVLRYFGFRLPGTFVKGVGRSIRGQRSPFVIGVLTGFLLGCGPLQAMYIMAAGTGSPQEGAILLSLFGLGTLVPLLGFGFFASYLSRRTMHELVRVSGILVIVMGLMMADRGLKMTQSGFDFASLRDRIAQEMHVSY
jgi:uncharacterized protein